MKNEEKKELIFINRVNFYKNPINNFTVLFFFLKIVCELRRRNRLQCARNGKSGRETTIVQIFLIDYGKSLRE